MIYIVNKKRKLDRVKKAYPDAAILDITSTTSLRYAQVLSPFYPHGNIPVPFSDGITAACVEGIWQGLKVFETTDIDIRVMQNRTMKNLKRTVRKYGKPLGHRKGIGGTELLNYHDARFLIYLPTYKWVLDNVPEVQMVIGKIRKQSKIQDIVLLDYNTNEDWNDLSKPLSHAALVKAYIEDNYPTRKGEPAATKPKKKSRKRKMVQQSLFPEETTACHSTRPTLLRHVKPIRSNND